MISAGATALPQRKKRSPSNVSLGFDAPGLRNHRRRRAGAGRLGLCGRQFPALKGRNMVLIYTVTRRYIGSIQSPIEEYSTRKRAAAEYSLKVAVYRAAESQGLRDTKAAWRAKAEGDASIEGASERRIELGSQAVILSVRAAD